MDPKKRSALETAGFRVGDAEDFLGLTEEEVRIVELRLAVGRAVRSRREAEGVSQKTLAARIKSTQPRVAKIEAAASDVSLDLMFRGLFAVGGSASDILGPASPTRKNGPTMAPVSGHAPSAAKRRGRNPVKA